MWAALLLLLFFVVTGCGTGSYNDGLEQRIQELNSAATESPDEETDEDASAGHDERPEDDELDEVPEEGPAADEEPPEDDVPEINEPL